MLGDVCMHIAKCYPTQGRGVRMDEKVFRWVGHRKGYLCQLRRSYVITSRHLADLEQVDSTSTFHIGYISLNSCVAVLLHTITSQHHSERQHTLNNH